MDQLDHVTSVIATTVKPRLLQLASTVYRNKLPPPPFLLEEGEVT